MDHSDKDLDFGGMWCAAQAALRRNFVVSASVMKMVLLPASLLHTASGSLVWDCSRFARR